MHRISRVLAAVAMLFLATGATAQAPPRQAKGTPATTVARPAPAVSVGAPNQVLSSLIYSAGPSQLQQAAGDAARPAPEPQDCRILCFTFRTSCAYDICGGQLHVTWFICQQPPDNYVECECDNGNGQVWMPC